MEWPSNQQFIAGYSYPDRQDYPWYTIVISAGTREGISHSFSQYMECRQIPQNCVVKASCYTESMKNKS